MSFLFGWLRNPWTHTAPAPANDDSNYGIRDRELPGGLVPGRSVEKWEEEHGNPHDRYQAWMMRGQGGPDNLPWPILDEVPAGAGGLRDRIETMPHFVSLSDNVAGAIICMQMSDEVMNWSNI